MSTLSTDPLIKWCLSPGNALTNVCAKGVSTSCWFPVLPGPATQIHVHVLSNAEAEHSIRFSQFEAWLNGTARSPKERLVKDRLRAVVGGE